MEKFKSILNVWATVFRNYRYVLVLLTSGFIFYVINGFLFNIRNIWPAFQIFNTFRASLFLFTLSLKFISVMNWFAAINITVISFLAGLLISLLVYRYNKSDLKDRKIGIIGGLGIFFGMAAPGCVACGLGVLGILGLASILIILPFKGNEVLVLSILLLSYSVINITGKIYNPKCKLSMDVSGENTYKINLKGGKK